jgi:hypothetical protein
VYRYVCTGTGVPVPLRKGGTFLQASFLAPEVQQGTRLRRNGERFQCQIHKKSGIMIEDKKEVRCKKSGVPLICHPACCQSRCF